MVPLLLDGSHGIGGCPTREKGQLRNCYILCEVEERYAWPGEMAPPTDPF
ncbi:hypothetical protein AB1L42_15560 [Thalassoglobus sp. JC818]